MSNVNKLKTVGFLVWADSEAVFVHLFDQMREARLIPQTNDSRYGIDPLDHSSPIA